MKAIYFKWYLCLSFLLDIYGYYSLLGVSENAPFGEIKKSYRKLVKKYHPDKNKDPSSKDTIKLLNIAYEVLSDQTKRKNYTQLRYNDNKNDAYFTGNDFYDFSEKEKESEPKTSHAKDTYENGFISSDKNLLDIQKSRFHITVEPSLCIAFGSCETLAPHVFYVEKNKIFNPKAIVKSETGDEFESIYDAAQTCPTKAIKITDRLTGQQIYP